MFFLEKKEVGQSRRNGPKEGRYPVTGPCRAFQKNNVIIIQAWRNAKMIAKLITRLFARSFFLIIIIPSISIAESEGGKGARLVFGVFPIMSPQALEKRFSPLANYLSGNLGKQVIVRSAGNFVEFLKRFGTGLGLPFRRELIAAHGGDIFVESVNREGKCFLREASLCQDHGGVITVNGDAG